MDLALGQRERAVGCERINVLMNERARGHGFSYVKGCESQRVTPERAGGGTHDSLVQGVGWRVAGGRRAG